MGPVIMYDTAIRMGKALATKRITAILCENA
jgi:hypothetical protein